MSKGKTTIIIMIVLILIIGIIFVMSLSYLKTSSKGLCERIGGIYKSERYLSWMGVTKIAESCEDASISNLNDTFFIKWNIKFREFN